MALTKELKIQSVVLLSKKPAEFSPANFNQYWLDSNKVISGSSIDRTSSFSPLIVQALSETLNLIVTPDQIQISPKKPEEFRDVVLNNTVHLVQNMDEIPLNGLGLNLNWILWDDNIAYDELSRRYFFNEKNPCSSFFLRDDSIFGDYLSKQLSQDVRLKLDIKPVHLFDLKTGGSKPCIQFAFNFHSDLRVENQKKNVIDILNNFDGWYDVTVQVMNFYN